MRELEILKYKRKYILVRDVITNKKYNILKKNTINKYSFPVSSSIIFVEREIELKVSAYSEDFLFFESDEDLEFLKGLNYSYNQFDEENWETSYRKNNTHLLEALSKYINNLTTSNSSIKIMQYFSTIREKCLLDAEFEFEAFPYEKVFADLDNTFEFRDSEKYIIDIDRVKLYLERVLECAKLSDLSHIDSYTVKHSLLRTEKAIRHIEENLNSESEVRKGLKISKDIRDFYLQLLEEVN